MIDDRLVLEQVEEQVDVFEGYSITLNNSGVYITIHPHEGGVVLNENSIFEQLNKKSIIEFNRNTIVSAIKESDGQPLKIAEKPVLSPVPEPDIHIGITRDRMESSIQITLPAGSKPLAMDTVFERIKKSGVAFGIDQEAIKKAYDCPGINLVFARGQQAINGNNGCINLHVEMGKNGHPEVLEDGSVDFKKLHLFTIVKEGELLAEKISPTLGMPGMDVLGHPIGAKPGKDVKMPVGKNVEIVDNTKIIAMIAGQVTIVNNKINVLPVIEIKDDVDVSTGNIEFTGNIVVRGSVQQGFSVKADGNVEIFGTVSGGIIEGKNVIIKMGIQGMHRGYVKAQENVVAKFIENATVHAGMDIIISDVVLHSRISAGGKVLVEGRRGLIAGGTIMAGEEIRAKVMGTNMSTSTELEVGVNPMLREEYQHIRREIKKVEVSLEQAQKALSILRTMNQNTMPPDKREMLLKLTKAQFHLVGQVETMRNRMTFIESKFEEMRDGHIKASDVIYPGVKVVVGTLVKPIRENLKFVSLYAEDGEIKSRAFK